MADLATLTKKGEVSIIKLDDGKANAFSLDMLESLNACLVEVPRDSGSLIITGREGLFSAGFDLKTLASGDAEAAGIYAASYSQDPEFYEFTRSMKAYVETFESKSDVMLIDSDSEFFKYLNDKIEE